MLVCLLLASVWNTWKPLLFACLAGVNIWGADLVKWLARQHVQKIINGFLVSECLSK